ncbi:MAG: hypothetical protein IKY17_04325 [Oscillospiraceae bacterium]|nr:hypothetical protein [Oscillospiraceae bacterium]
MKKKGLFVLWGVLFAVCAGLGFVGQPAGVLKWILSVLGLVFFAPPAVLLSRAKQFGDLPTAALVRNIAAASLGLTLVLLVANFLSLLGGEALGNVLNVILAIVSVPMFCGQIWVLTLFCWAFLMIAANKLVKQMKKTQA